MLNLKYSYILKRNYKYILFMISFTIIGVFIYFWYYKKLNSNDQVVEPIIEPNNNIDIIKAVEEEVEDSDKNKIYVDIKGMINNPGVYELDEGAKVIDLINISGGLKEGADTSLINLSKKLKDEMVVIIYSHDEVSKTENNTVIKYIEKTCVCPQVKNDVCINNESEIVNNSETNSQEEDMNIYPISINKADINLLTKLPSIGEAKAKKIIEYREANGDFKNVEEIMNVSGIGTTIFDAIKDFITI